MYLSVQWVKNLEKDGYSQAPALIYVRGYLRRLFTCLLMLAVLDSDLKRL
ncbi:MAG: helix-turn-helix domain-containing protein [Coxiella endosymbiont of Dermacentor nuttalli]